MSAKNRTGATSAADVEKKLPRTFFVKRGDIMNAFGLSKKEIAALVPEVFTPAPVTQFKRDRFARTAVLAVAQRWEAAGVFGAKS